MYDKKDIILKVLEQYRESKSKTKDTLAEYYNLITCLFKISDSFDGFFVQSMPDIDSGGWYSTTTGHIALEWKNIDSYVDRVRMYFSNSYDDFADIHYKDGKSERYIVNPFPEIVKNLLRYKDTMKRAKFYTKRPVTIQAMEWAGDNLLEVTSFIEGKDIILNTAEAKSKWEEYAEIVRERGLTVGTLEGPMRADIGDYIIKGIKDEFYPCKPDIFKATYDEAEDLT